MMLHSIQNVSFSLCRTSSYVLFWLYLFHRNYVAQNKLMLPEIATQIMRSLFIFIQSKCKNVFILLMMAQNHCYFSPKHPIPNRKSDVALVFPVVKGKFLFVLCAHTFCCCSNDCKIKFKNYYIFVVVNNYGESFLT